MPMITTNNDVEMDESLDLSDENFVNLDESNQSLNGDNKTSVENDDDDDDENLRSKLIKKRKPQLAGKWMNVETFELKNDDEDEDDDEVSTPLPMVDINFKPVVRKPVLMAKTSDRSLNVN
ncbi:hypothetical protein BLA29_013553, partial [Euroglyphus maynei]